VGKGHKYDITVEKRRHMEKKQSYFYCLNKSGKENPTHKKLCKRDRTFSGRGKQLMVFGFIVKVISREGAAEIKTKKRLKIQRGKTAFMILEKSRAAASSLQRPQPQVI